MIRRISPMALFFLFAGVLCAALAGADGRPVASMSVSAVFRGMAGCPFGFQEGMPPGVFCVYDGIAIGADGHACDDRVIVIWARLACGFETDGGLDEDVADRADLHFGFVTFPDLLIRAGVDEYAERATIIDYTLGEDQPPVRLRGTAETRLVRTAGGEGAEILGLRIDRPVLASETCAFTSYDGLFVGVMTLPPGATR